MLQESLNVDIAELEQLVNDNLFIFLLAKR